MIKNEHERCIILRKAMKRGRKINFRSDTILEILRAVGTKSSYNDPISSMEIAKKVREEDNSYNSDKSKFSKEFKVIKKLTRAGFFKKVLKPHIAEQLSKAREEYELAKSEYESYDLYCQKKIGDRRKARPTTSISDATELLEIRSWLADGFEKLLTMEEKKRFDDKHQKAISTYEQLQDIRSKMVDSDGSTSKSKAWGYVLTFRGFLLYLYNESKAEETKNELQSVLVPTTGKKKKGKVSLTLMAMRQERVNNIHKVLKNPVMLEEAPFLKYWQCFEDHGFQIVNILLQIAVNLESQLLTAAQKYANYIFETATKHYFVEFENYLSEILDPALYYFHAKDVGNVKYAELLETRNNYRREVMIPILSEFKAKDEEFLNYLQEDCDRVKLN